MAGHLAPNSRAEHENEGQSGAVVKRTLARALLCLSFIMPGTAQAAPSTPAESRAVEAAFISGLTSLDANNPKQAIPLFLGVLAKHPDLVRVRLELGRAYFADGQWSNARREFLLALSADLPDPVRRNVLGFIRAIDARRGFDWDISLSLTELRSNENYKTDTIDLNLGGFRLPFTLNRRDEKELGLTFSASASLRGELSELNGPNFVTTAFVEALTFGDYAESETLRDYSYGMRGGLRFSAPRTTSSIALVATRRDVSTTHFEDRAGVELAFERRGGNGFSVFGSTQLLDVDNARTDTLDGTSVFGEAGIRQSFSGRSLIGILVFGEARRTDLKFESFDRIGVSVFGSVEARFGLSIRPSVTLSRKDFLSPSPLFADDPDETELTGRLRIEKTDLIFGNGFSPFIQMEATEVTSGIDAFSYWSRDVSIGIRRVF